MYFIDSDSDGLADNNPLEYDRDGDGFPDINDINVMFYLIILIEKNNPIPAKINEFPLFILHCNTFDLYS